MAEFSDQSMQPITGRPGLITKVHPLVFRGQSRDQPLHALRRGIELAQIPDLSISAGIRDRHRVAELRDIDPDKNFLWRRHDRPPMMRTDAYRDTRGDVSLFGKSVPFLRPGLLLPRRCAQPLSGMAEGHRVAARSVLDGGEHNATLAQVGDHNPGRVRSSWKRTCGLTTDRPRAAILGSGSDIRSGVLRSRSSGIRFCN